MAGLSNSNCYGILYGVPIYYSGGNHASGRRSIFYCCFLCIFSIPKNIIITISRVDQKQRSKHKSFESTSKHFFTGKIKDRLSDLCKPKNNINTIVIKRIVDSTLLTFAKISIPRRFSTNRIRTPTIAIALTVIFGRRLLIYNGVVCYFWAYTDQTADL